MGENKEEADVEKHLPLPVYGDLRACVNTGGRIGKIIYIYG